MVTTASTFATDGRIAATIVLLIPAYAIGSLPLGYWLARRRGVDIRGLGTGNVGTSNIFRNVGMSLAAVVGPLQFLQGVIPVAGTRLLGGGTGAAALAGLAAVAGNGWSPWLRWHGGRGIAVATGVVAGTTPAGFVLLLVVYAAGALTRHIAAAVLLAYIALPAEMLLLGDTALAACFTILLALLLARRLEGVSDDVRRHGAGRRMLVERVLNDRRPGRPLVGRRRDTDDSGGVVDPAH